MPQPTLSRRRFLLLGGCSLAAASLPTLAQTAIAAPDASLSFYHLHTGESLRRVIWREGGFVESSLRDIDQLLRDHRSGEATRMDRRLLVLLYQLQQRVQTDAPFEVISAYRSPTSNALLASRSNGVAKRSLHMEGQAIDIRLPGVSLQTLRNQALTLKGGGVGYYPKDQFIHLDVGRVRQWG